MFPASIQAEDPMRDLPTPEQCRYLEAIGVLPATSPAAPAWGKPPRRSSSRITWIGIAVWIMLVLRAAVFLVAHV
jgi:hypothetical protein